jgi:hypothetical protein
VTRTRTAAVAVFGLRVAYGVALVAAPARITRSWLGPAVEGDATQVVLRGLGGREVLLHGFGIAAAMRGKPLLPWLLVSMGGDLTDIAATVAGSGGIPGDAPKKTAAVAGGSAALTAAVLAVELAG